MPLFYINHLFASIFFLVTQEYFQKASRALADVIVDTAWTVTVEEEGKAKNAKNIHDVEKIIAEATKAKKQKRLAAATDVDEPQNDSSDDEVNETKEPVAVVTVRGIEESGLHIVLKKVIKNDKERLSQNESAETFGSILVQKLNDDTARNTIFDTHVSLILI